MPASENTEPTDRSMPPVITTSRTPNDMMTSGAAACAMSAMFPQVSADGTSTPTATSSAMMARAMATSVR